MDWNNDGKLDILSGCYWTQGEDAGQIQLLAGKGTLDFEVAVSITDARGQPLENVQVDDKKDQAMSSNQTSAICTEQHAVDYDGDGDLDLVVGCFANNFYLYTNEGAPGEPAALSKPVELDLKSPGYHSAPHLADWDGDGDLDFLTGSSDGGVYLATNTGNRAEPVWSKFETIVPASNANQQSISSGKPIAMSASTRVWATDWNHDGRLDLLIGDSTTLQDPAPGLSQEDYEEKLQDWNKKVAAHSTKQTKLYEQIEAAEKSGDDIPEPLQELRSEYNAQFRKLYEAKSEFQESKSTGYVWLLIQKPAKQSVAKNQ